MKSLLIMVLDFTLQLSFKELPLVQFDEVSNNTHSSLKNALKTVSFSTTLCVRLDFIHILQLKQHCSTLNIEADIRIHWPLKSDVRLTKL